MESTACSSSSSGVRTRRAPVFSSIESLSAPELGWFTAARGPPLSPLRCDLRDAPPPECAESTSRCMKTKYSLLKRLPLNTNCRFWVITWPRICRGISGGDAMRSTLCVKASPSARAIALGGFPNAGVAVLDGGIDAMRSSDGLIRS